MRVPSVECFPTVKDCGHSAMMALSREYSDTTQHLRNWTYYRFGTGEIGGEICTFDRVAISRHTRYRHHRTLPLPHRPLR